MHLGLLSAIPRSLGLAAPSDIFSREQLDTMIADAEAHVPYFANKFSNGNPALAKGIEAQYKLMLARYALNKELPLEMNLGEGVAYYQLIASRHSRRAWLFRSDSFHQPSP